MPLSRHSSLLALAALFPLAARAQLPDRARMAAQVDSIARAAIARGPLAGLSVGIMRGPSVVLLRGYGLADRERKVPVAPTTTFKIGSITKQFTALAILQLAEQGKLSLEDDLSKWVPDFPMRGRTIPVSMLLTHTSGIKNYTELGRAYWQDTFKLDLPHARLVGMFADRPDDFRPGEDFSYTNSAFYLAGMVIEKASGQTYDQYLRSHIFEPLGLSSTSYCDDRVTEGRAVGYAFERGKLARAEPLSMTVPFAAGALCSSTVDLLRYERALLGGRIVRPASWQRMTTPARLADGWTTGYGFGLAVDDDYDGERAIGHGGQINGYWASLVHYPARDLTVVVLSNVNPAGGEPLWTIAQRIARVASGRPASRVTTSAPVDPARLSRWAGGWQLGRERLTLVPRGASFDLAGLSRAPMPLRYQGNDVFLSDEDLMLRVQLEPGATPAADRLRVRLGVLPIAMRASRAAPTEARR